MDVKVTGLIFAEWIALAESWYIFATSWVTITLSRDTLHQRLVED
jgi:hypothetical protein